MLFLFYIILLLNLLSLQNIFFYLFHLLYIYMMYILSFELYHNFLMILDQKIFYIHFLHLISYSSYLALHLLFLISLNILLILFYHFLSLIIHLFLKMSLLMIFLYYLGSCFYSLKILSQNDSLQIDLLLFHHVHQTLQIYQIYCCCLMMLYVHLPFYNAILALLKLRIECMNFHHLNFLFLYLEYLGNHPFFFFFLIFFE